MEEVITQSVELWAPTASLSLHQLSPQTSTLCESWPCTAVHSLTYCSSSPPLHAGWLAGRWWSTWACQTNVSIHKINWNNPPESCGNNWIYPFTSGPFILSAEERSSQWGGSQWIVMQQVQTMHLKLDKQECNYFDTTTTGINIVGTWRWDEMGLTDRCSLMRSWVIAIKLRLIDSTFLSHLNTIEEFDKEAVDAGKWCLLTFLENISKYTLHFLHVLVGWQPGSLSFSMW